MEVRGAKVVYLLYKVNREVNHNIKKHRRDPASDKVSPITVCLENGSNSSSMTFCSMALKKMQRLMSVSQTFTGSTFFIAIGSNDIISM